MDGQQGDVVAQAVLGVVAKVVYEVFDELVGVGVTHAVTCSAKG